MGIYNKERSMKTREFVSNAKYGITVAISSVAATILVPLIGSYIGGQTKFPQTITEWILYFACAFAISLCSMMIFLALHNQGKLNVKDNEEYLKAKEMYKARIKKMNKKIVPKDPFKWESSSKTKKAIFQFFSTFLGILGLSLGALCWNSSQFVSAVISIVLAISFGLIHMGDVERMFTEGWLEFEEFMAEEIKEQEKKKELEEKLYKEQTLEEQIKEVIDENQQ